MSPPRSIAGQASAEYVALLAVVGVIVAGAAAVGPVPGIAGRVAGAIRHGVCLVAGGVCTPREARAAGLAPCLVHAQADRERLGARVLVVRLGRGDALLVERRSDGSAAVSFADGDSAGAAVALGVWVPGGTKVGMNADAGLQFTAGRRWEFPSFAAARRFVHRWARTETMTGELRGAFRHGPSPPPPDSRYVEGGAFGDFAAAVRAGLRRGAAGAEEAGEAGLVVGRRIGRDGRVTWYGRLGAETAARLGVVLGAVEGHQAGEVSLEVASVHGRASELRLRAAARTHGDLGLDGPASSVSDLVGWLRGNRGVGGAGRRVEVEVALDLTDPENRRAVQGVVDVMALRVAPADWDDRVRALAARLDADGAVDVRVFRVGLEQRDLGTNAALGLGFGAGYERRREVRDLLRAWSLRPGGSLREREDCAPA